ncbi:Stp1/IreP family PP2C-type Ser/Thr phosphatase [Thermosyntropha sp.]|uniref:Stp1/IreP family PP2C-type Ser/Thr phosphatase n=1 Tax=Thermosyntropha sp. TaxID=2740820 RepID=UPI0025DF1D93|nr:Stp1/IreP family PP2C-type Ser/Thr phosphatase [Thermosyntropha sp.]MBO8158513.1 Stp1/IreP family PP2C-type Ser/Thr phosphatase [Thermosyntropha sp.]
MKSVGISDQGLVRHRNEDNYLIKESQGLFVVCDGMGGHKGGHIASNLAVQIIADETENLDTKQIIDLIDQIIKKANSRIWEIGQNDPECYEMGTTITACVIDQNKLHIWHVGDSRLYIIRNNEIKQITRDHTLAEQMIADGLFKDGESSNTLFSHILTRALGISEEIEVDHYTEEISCNDIILICTDGLSNMLKDEEILAIIITSADNCIEKTARELLNKALENGGYDNITLILIQI